MKEINLMNNAMFKALFRSKEARGLIANILSIALDIDKEKLIYAEYNAGELVKDKIYDKGKTCDILVTIDDGNKIIIEMNKLDNKNIFSKNVSYFFSVINENVKREEKNYIYPNTKHLSVTLINIDASNKFKTNEGILDFRIRDEEGHIETDLYRSIYLIPDNLVNIKYNKDIRKFVLFLKEKDLYKLREDFKGERDYMACIRKVEDLIINPKFIEYYDLEEAHEQDISTSYDNGYDTGYNEGEQSGVTKGITRRNIEIAKKMLQKKIDIKDISDISDLTTHEIENLK